LTWDETRTVHVVVFEDEVDQRRQLVTGQSMDALLHVSPS
jgi:hypothetical protein